jgi:hypothetical protein
MATVTGHTAEYIAKEKARIKNSDPNLVTWDDARIFLLYNVKKYNELGVMAKYQFRQNHIKKLQDYLKSYNKEKDFMEEKEDFDIESELSSGSADDSDPSKDTQLLDNVQQQNYNDFKDIINDMFNINNKRDLINKEIDEPPKKIQSYV